MSAYIDARMPRKLAAGFRFAPQWNTGETSMVNGTERRDQRWLFPKWRGTGRMAALDTPECEAFLDMMMATRGKFAAFRVRIPVVGAWKATDQPLAPVVGTQTPVQLVTRHYFPGSATAYAESMVQAPVAGSVTVLHRATAGDAPTVVSGTLDTDLGLFTPDANWATGLHSWSGKYDRWMRFTNDWNPLVAEDPKVMTADIELIEVRRRAAA